MTITEEPPAIIPIVVPEDDEEYNEDDYEYVDPDAVPIYRPERHSTSAHQFAY